MDGVSKTTFLTLRYLQQTGREVMVFAPDIAPSAVGDSRVIALPSLGFASAPETRMALPHPVIAQYLDEFKPDLIQLCSPAVLSMSGMLAARQNRIPVIANYQTDIPGYAHAYGYGFMADLTRNWLRYLHNGCHLTLVPSTFTMKQLTQWGYRRLRRWGRGVDGERFSPNKASAEWRARLLNGRDPDSLLCIYAGRLANEKRVDLLLELARLPGVALTLIGDGALREELETLFAGTGTHFTGYLYGEDLADAYASADVFAFAGGVETFGQVVQEAMASGLPAIVVNEGGVTDIVTDGVNGFVVAPTVEAFADAARRLRDDDDLYTRLSDNARAYAEERPWSAVMAEMETHYADAVRINERLSRLHPPTVPLFHTLLERGRMHVRRFVEEMEAMP